MKFFLKQKIILIFQKYFFWAYSKWWQIKQSTPGLNSSLLWNFWQLRSANHVKFTECVMCVYREVCFSQKMFTNRLKICLLLWAWVEKTVTGIETHWLSGIEKVLGTVVNKEGHVHNVLGHERTYHNWFPWKRCNCKQCFLLPTY